jgi:hypothetical protein
MDEETPHKMGHIHICEERIVTIFFKNTTSRTEIQTPNTMKAMSNQRNKKL